MRPIHTFLIVAFLFVLIAVHTCGHVQSVPEVRACQCPEQAPGRACDCENPLGETGEP